MIDKNSLPPRSILYMGASLAAILLLGCSDAKVEKTDTIINSDITGSCEAFAANNTNSAVNVHSSQTISQTKGLPAFCQITGKIEPNIGFEARYPLTNWNGKYFQAGCGGFCGVVEVNRETQSNAINHALRRGYATITTDAGHEGAHLGDGTWAKDNPDAERVYAHEVLPLTHAAGHDFAQQLYGTAPSYSYFSGCSNGGRLAAIAAQRYPALFDGIVAGCPVLNLSINGGVFGAWVLQANSDSQGGRILDHNFKPKLAMLEANAYAQCDGRDGQEDGVISDPFNCRVDLGTIPICEESNEPACLTAEEKAVTRKWYDGPIDSSGTQIFPGMAPGSERFWGHWYLGNESFPGAGTLLADGYGTYLGFPEDPDSYSALNFNFDQDVPKLATQGVLYNALDPDLSAFRNAGGKMIMWHGMADPLVLPQQSPDYYRAVEKTMGGSDEVEGFFRLFMVPGMGHCWELPAALPDNMSMLGALEQWVEHGLAPDAIPINRFNENGSVMQSGELRPYPQKATYSPHP